VKLAKKQQDIGFFCLQHKFLHNSNTILSMRKDWRRTDIGEQSTKPMQFNKLSEHLVGALNFFWFRFYTNGGVRESMQYRSDSTVDKRKLTFEVNKVNDHAFW
jgi:hypothetical protein